MCEQFGIGATATSDIVVVAAGSDERRVMAVRRSSLLGGKWGDKGWHLAGGAEEHVVI